MLAATYGRNQLLTSEPKLRNQSWLSLLSLRLFLWMSPVFQIEKFWEDSVVFEWPKTEDLSAILEDGSGASVAFACGLSDGFRDDAVECSRFTGFQTQSECCQVKNLRPEHNQHWTENPKIHFSAFSQVVSLVCIRCSGLRWSAYRSKLVCVRSTSTFVMQTLHSLGLAFVCIRLVVTCFHSLAFNRWPLGAPLVGLSADCRKSNRNDQFSNKSCS